MCVSPKRSLDFFCRYDATALAAIHIKSDVDAGRIEGVKVHNCNLVAVNTGIRADSVLELSAVQNHINCAQAGIVAINADQCFFMAQPDLSQQWRGCAVLSCM